MPEFTVPNYIATDIDLQNLASRFQTAMDALLPRDPSDTNINALTLVRGGTTGYNVFPIGSWTFFSGHIFRVEVGHSSNTATARGFWRVTQTSPDGSNANSYILYTSTFENVVGESPCRAYTNGVSWLTLGSGVGKPDPTLFAAEVIDGKVVMIGGNGATPSGGTYRYSRVWGPPLADWVGPAGANGAIALSPSGVPYGSPAGEVTGVLGSDVGVFPFFMPPSRSRAKINSMVAYYPGDIGLVTEFTIGDIVYLTMGPCNWLMPSGLAIAMRKS